MIVSCSSDGEPKRKVTNEIQHEAKITQSPSKIEKTAFEYYTKKDIDLGDTSKLLTILKKISNIREVRKFSEFHVDTVLYWVMESSIHENPYKINVGLDYGDHYSTTYIFYVNKNGRDVKILEIVEDSLMSINDWRKNPYYKIQQRGIFGK